MGCRGLNSVIAYMKVNFNFGGFLVIKLGHQISCSVQTRTKNQRLNF